jgi:hypothetical protein
LINQDINVHRSAIVPVRNKGHSSRDGVWNAQIAEALCDSAKRFENLVLSHEEPRCFFERRRPPSSHFFFERFINSIRKYIKRKRERDCRAPGSRIQVT